MERIENEKDKLDYFWGPDDENVARTIFVDLDVYPEVSHEEIYGFFEQFGEIESIKYTLAADRQFILHKKKPKQIYIHFKNADDAAKLLLKREMSWRDGKIRITPVDIHHHHQVHNSDLELIPEYNFDEYPLLHPPETDSPNNILNALNDDCLYEIFKKIKSLPMLCSIANVCVKFHEIAKQVFASKYKNKAVHILCEFKCYSDQIDKMQIVFFLFRFGSSIESMDISCDWNCDDIDIIEQKKSYYCDSTFFLKIINKYCENISDLRIKMSEWNDNQLPEMQPLLSRLKKLSISTDDFCITSDFISACSQLESLTIGLSPEVKRIVLPEITLPKLIEFKCNELGRRYRELDSCLEQFLKCNPQLKILQLSSISNHLCHFIGQNMLNLQKLTISNLTEYVNFDQLKHLKDLKLTLRYRYCYGKELHLHLLRRVSVEHLELIRIPFSKATINSISQIDCLKSLKIDIFEADITDGICFVELTKNLLNLENLSICAVQPDGRTIRNEVYKKKITDKVKISVLRQTLQCTNQLSELSYELRLPDFVPFNENDYYEILKVVKKRTDRKRLRIKIVNLRAEFTTEGNSVSTKYMIFDMEPDWLIFEQEDKHLWYDSNKGEKKQHWLVAFSKF